MLCSRSAPESGADRVPCSALLRCHALAHHFQHACAALLIVFAMFGSPLAQADAMVRYAEIRLGGDGYVVNADIDFDLHWRLADAVNRGVSLNFSADFVISKPRWYWFDQSVVERSLDFRLSYHAITRSYRLSAGTVHRNYDTLEDALNAMRRIRSWQVADAGALESGLSYSAMIRFRHDLSQLPKPFQVTALSNRDWILSTDWMSWTFLAGPSR